MLYQQSVLQYFSFTAEFTPSSIDLRPPPQSYVELGSLVNDYIQIVGRLSWLCGTVLIIAMFDLGKLRWSGGGKGNECESSTEKNKARNVPISFVANFKYV